jgi:hypothetical protein
MSTDDRPEPEHEWGYWKDVHGERMTIEECAICGAARPRSDVSPPPADQSDVEAPNTAFIEESRSALGMEATREMLLGWIARTRAACGSAAASGAPRVATRISESRVR